MDHARVRPDRGLHCRLVKRTLRVAGNVPLLALVVQSLTAICTRCARGASLGAKRLQELQSTLLLLNTITAAAHKECDALSGLAPAIRVEPWSSKN